MNKFNLKTIISFVQKHILNKNPHQLISEKSLKHFDIQKVVPCSYENLTKTLKPQLQNHTKTHGSQCSHEKQFLAVQKLEQCISVYWIKISKKK